MNAVSNRGAKEGVTDRTRTGEPNAAPAVRAPQVVGKTTRKEVIDQAE